ncbi:hypothetical protein [Brevibacillus reuszeri]|uniref:hypothetical protein n=1 Tax=Brevibacillus reuszeri TaxID=54915 RepID=UPI000CCC5CE9|nr:hypothetical protein [Brevibacillus reuszeri]
MSVVACFVNNSFAIIATDTRIQFGKGKDVINIEHKKLHSIPAGWAAGCGSVNVIEGFIEECKRLSRMDSTTVHGIFTSLLVDDLNKYGNDWSELIKLTKVAQCLAIKEEHGSSMVIRVTGEDLDGYIEKGYPYVIWPADIDMNTIEELSKEFEEYTRLKIKDDLRYLQFAVAIMAGIISKVSSLSDTVSPVCDAGIIYRTSTGSLELLHIKGHVNELLTEFNSEQSDFSRFYTTED